MKGNRFASLLNLLVFPFLVFQTINGADTIEQGQPITYPNTIISAGGRFELGFFSPGNTSKYYVGIWHKVSNRSIVWVANREYPLPRQSSNLSINDDGKLAISDDKTVYEVTEGITNRKTYARLLDSDYLDFGHNWSLVSWRTLEDPAPGSFSLELNDESLVIKKGSKTYWTDTQNLFRSSGSFRLNQSRHGYWKFPNTSEATQILLDVLGQLKLQSWSEDDKRWHTLESSKCPYHRCGAFSICSITTETPCSCLEGFERIKNGKSEGCMRKTDLQCSTEEGQVQNDGFLLKSFVEYPSGGYGVNLISNAAACRSECLNNCSCIAYAYDAKLKHGCLVWYGDLFDLKQLPHDDENGNNFYLKLAASELKIDTSTTNGTAKDQKKKRNNRQLWIIGILTLSLSTLVLGFGIYFIRKRLQPRGEDLLKFDLAVILQYDDTKEPGIHRKHKSKLQLFSFASVSAATDNFSAANKLGEGGFGPVYKGVLLKGDEIAVKRLSRRSGQGWEELKNEALVIAKLQHKNLVRLLGCCVERDEKILIYEYMPNKSLDFFLFDSIKRRVLDWETRVQITEGIVQGILYLRQYSRLRIIHRDLKASNILGYMSPEYALEGLFSVKSDVFSFGVLLLEIVSGKKNTGFYQSKSLYLLAHAWDLWTSNSAMDLIDPTLEEVPTHTAIRYVNIGLLCVQEIADDRPTMSDVFQCLPMKAWSYLILNNQLSSIQQEWRKTTWYNRAVLDAR
ncbi:hypothetical protein like AT4G21390 [Hibiscus trionum]|uniref:Receptor-like serine/threonine-protein kinase n=1 Tax=Hibiscus trionum TaxID=183268 RepID=A0A9W7MI24_HIBTR|nr:hypothetical protein like AT4G21390 [Hibiscus trionum]